MERVTVIGSPGAGKSTLSRQMARSLDLPLYHLDRLFWQPGWVPSDYGDFVARQRDLARRARWIIDGNYSSSLGVRLTRTDTVVFLDLPRTVCLWRVLRRALRGRLLGTDRPDMASGCPERLDREFLEFLRYIWRFPEERRPKIISMIEEVPPSVRVLTLSSPGEVAVFIRGLG